MSGKNRFRIKVFVKVSSSFTQEYNSQHLKWIKKVHQRCHKTRTHFGFGF